MGLGRNQKTDKATGAKKQKLAPGMIMELDAGDEIQVVNPSGQASNAKGYGYNSAACLLSWVRD